MRSRIVRGLAASGLLLALSAFMLSAEAQTQKSTPQTRLVGVVNIDYAGSWTTKPWRFYERHNRYVSVAPRD